MQFNKSMQCINLQNCREMSAKSARRPRPHLMDQGRWGDPSRSKRGRPLCDFAKLRMAKLVAALDAYRNIRTACGSGWNSEEVVSRAFFYLAVVGCSLLLPEAPRRMPSLLYEGMRAAVTKDVNHKSQNDDGNWLCDGEIPAIFVFSCHDVPRVNPFIPMLLQGEWMNKYINIYKQNCCVQIDRRCSLLCNVLLWVWLLFILEPGHREWNDRPRPKRTEQDMGYVNATWDFIDGCSKSTTLIGISMLRTGTEGAPFTYFCKSIRSHSQFDNDAVWLAPTAVWRSYLNVCTHGMVHLESAQRCSKCSPEFRFKRAEKNP